MASQPACTRPGVDPELFHSTDRHDIVAAKAICSDCPVVRQCLLTALDERLDGIWGGTTLGERMKRSPRRFGPAPSPIVHGTRSGYQKHRNRDEEACQECKAAASAYAKQQKARQAEMAVAS